MFMPKQNVQSNFRLIAILIKIDWHIKPEINLTLSSNSIYSNSKQYIYNINCHISSLDDGLPCSNVNNSIYWRIPSLKGCFFDLKWNEIVEEQKLKVNYLSIRKRIPISHCLSQYRIISYVLRSAKSSRRISHSMKMRSMNVEQRNV